MKLADYTLPLDGVDWQAIFAPFAPILPERFQLMFVSRFADAFMLAPDESVWILDVNLGAVSRLADDREHFADQIDANHAAWLMTPLVDACAAAGRGLMPRQCYAFTEPVLHGGAYRVENVHVAEIEQALDELGALFRRTRGLHQA